MKLQELVEKYEACPDRSILNEITDEIKQLQQIINKDRITYEKRKILVTRTYCETVWPDCGTMNWEVRMSCAGEVETIEREETVEEEITVQIDPPYGVVRAANDAKTQIRDIYKKSNSFKIKSLIGGQCGFHINCILEDSISQGIEISKEDMQGLYSQSTATSYPVAQLTQANLEFLCKKLNCDFFDIYYDIFENQPYYKFMNAIRELIKPEEELIKFFREKISSFSEERLLRLYDRIAKGPDKYVQYILTVGKQIGYDTFDIYYKMFENKPFDDFLKAIRKSTKSDYEFAELFEAKISSFSGEQLLRLYNRLTHARDKYDACIFPVGRKLGKSNFCIFWDTIPLRRHPDLSPNEIMLLDKYVRALNNGIRERLQEAHSLYCDTSAPAEIITAACRLFNESELYTDIKLMQSNQPLPRKTLKQIYHANPVKINDWIEIPSVFHKRKAAEKLGYSKSRIKFDKLLAFANPRKVMRALLHEAKNLICG